MSDHKRGRLFRYGRHQAVRIPVEFELPGREAIVHRDGDRLVIEPVRKRGLIALLQSMTPCDELIPEIDDPPAFAALQPSYGRRAAMPATHPSKRAPCGHYRPLQPAPRNPIVPCRDGANA